MFWSVSPPVSPLAMKLLIKFDSLLHTCFLLGEECSTSKAQRLPDSVRFCCYRILVKRRGREGLEIGADLRGCNFGARAHVNTTLLLFCLHITPTPNIILFPPTSIELKNFIAGSIFCICRVLSFL